MKGKDDDDEEYYEDTREDSRDNRIRECQTDMKGI